MNIWITGDLHQNIAPIRKFYENTDFIADDENWIICLGDVGANYYFDYRDWKFKQELSQYPFKYFMIRGNHEERASNRARVEPDLWEEVECFGNTCLRQPVFPNIYYANDAGGIYDIAGRKSLIIPGSYSVDKWYRLERGWSWFSDEQLTAQEMANLETLAAGQHFDLVLSHTSPYSKMPTDLFLPGVDQSQVDNSMELWMDQLTEKITYNLHCWGHYHEDRVEAPKCEMFYREVENLADVEARWARYTETGELDWWIPKAPGFYKYTK